jgi:hypothetical protein
VGGLTFVRAACFDGGCLRRIHSFVAVTLKAQVEAGLARPAVTEPDARAESRAGDVHVVSQAVEGGHALGARRRSETSRP